MTKEVKRLKIEIVPSFSGEIRNADEILQEAIAQGWTDDPGQGKAVLIKDDHGNPAYEVFNPMGFAPPIGFEPTPPIDQLIRDRVALEVERLKDEDEIDSEDEVNDFDEPDELPPLETMYEVIAMEAEAPRIPEDRKQKSISDRAKELLELEETMTRERLLKKRHREAALKKQQDELNELYSTPPGGDQENP